MERTHVELLDSSILRNELHRFDNPILEWIWLVAYEVSQSAGGFGDSEDGKVSPEPYFSLKRISFKAVLSL